MSGTACTKISRVKEHGESKAHAHAYRLAKRAAGQDVTVGREANQTSITSGVNKVLVILVLSPKLLFQNIFIYDSEIV